MTEMTARLNILEEALCNATRCGNVSVALDALVSAALTEAECLSVPVDLERVAAVLGVVSIQTADIPCDGVLAPIDSTHYRIMLSEFGSPARRRFSLAHELGHAIVHCVLPETRRLATRSLFLPAGCRAEERICDSLAARLLMPREQLASMLGSGFRIGTIREVAQRFRVSVSAAAIRCKEVLGLDFALLSFEAVPREDSAILRRVLTDFATARLRPKLASVFEPPSLFGQAAATNLVQKGWEWIKQGSIRRRLFVDCEGGRSWGGQFLAVVSRAELSQEETKDGEA